MNSEPYPMPTRTFSSCASAWSTPPRFTTLPRSGSQRSGLITRPRPSYSLVLSRTAYWTWTSSSTSTGLMSNQSWAPGHGAWRRRSGLQTTLSVHHSRRRTWRRRLMRPSSPPLRTKLARPRRGGFLTGAPKLSPDAAGRSSSASSELKTVNPVGCGLYFNFIYFNSLLLLQISICGGLVYLPVKCLAHGSK